MNKQRALEILQNAIIEYSWELPYGNDEEARRKIVLDKFDMTEDEYDYIFKYNFELKLRNNLSRSLGGAEFISEEEDED